MNDFGFTSHIGDGKTAVANALNVKAVEAFVLDMLAPLRSQHGVADGRWAAIGFTDLEKAFMSLSRACMELAKDRDAVRRDLEGRILGGVE